MTIHMLLHADPIDWPAISARVAARFRIQILDGLAHVVAHDGTRPMVVEWSRREDASLEALEPGRWPARVRPQLVARGRRSWVRAGSSMDDFLAWRDLLAELVDALIYDPLNDTLIDRRGAFIDPDDLAPAASALGTCVLELGRQISPADLLAAAQRVSKDLELCRIDNLAPNTDGWPGFSAAVLGRASWRRVAIWDPERSFTWYRFDRGGDLGQAQLVVELDPALTDPSDPSAVGLAIPQLRALAVELAALGIRVIACDPVELLRG